GPSCPFCTGNEGTTPPEVLRIGDGEKNKPGWQVRVVPNKFPITDIHEVIVHSPDHEKGLEALPPEHVPLILTAYRERYKAHQSAGHVIIFCNLGLHAGASLKHPHSQLVVVPRQINLDALSREPIANVVSEDELFIVYCPYFSQWPYEVWIAPKKDDTLFGDITDDELSRLSIVFPDALRRISRVLTDPKLQFRQANEPFIYNYYIYHGKKWFVRIIPRAVHRAGFELGSGLNVNVVDPTDAAERLRSVSF
ncbi:hypothetical protein A2Z33_00720, partial [Candidatus Gottesmanbacteria bacterium RBG_16_52_11]